MNKNVFVTYELWIDGNRQNTFSEVIEVNQHLTSIEDIDKLEDFIKGDRYWATIVVTSFSRLEEEK